jgi:predicted dehydrogenase
MSSFEPLRTVVVDCGDISRGYGASLRTSPDRIKLIGAFDIDSGRAEAFVEQYGGRVYSDLEEFTADADVELVVNLTSHLAHAEVSAAALSARKHVHSEKPLAVTREDGKHLLNLAEKHGVREGQLSRTRLPACCQTIHSLDRRLYVNAMV